MSGAHSLAGWVISLDLWGTLISHGDRAAAMHWRVAEFTRVLDAFGHPRTTRHVHHTAVKTDAAAISAQRERGIQPTTHAQLAEVLAALDVATSIDLVSVLATVHTHAVLRGCPQPEPGAHQALAALAADGARVVLTSNTLATSAVVHRELLDDLGLSGYFDDMVFSGELGIAKPRPEVFATVAARAGVSLDRVVHVGDDDRTDIRGALAAGCRALRYDPDASPTRLGAPRITHLDQLTDALHALCQPLPRPEPL